jgi:replicative superfamily II helicase
LTPDVTRAQRRLRSFRIRDLLGEPPPEDRERQDRDTLLPFVGELAHTTSPSIDSLEPWATDATVSLTLARVLETSLDSLSVLAAGSQVLAADGHFVRLRPIAARFQDLGIQLRSERPALSVTLDSFAHLLMGYRAAAERLLGVFLGITEEPEALIERDWSNIADVYLANALRFWLATGSQDRLERARQLGLTAGDSVLLEMSQLCLAYAGYADVAAVRRIVPQADSSFRAPRLEAYLRRRGIDVLLPAQMKAIAAGALEDRTRLIAMPTSSGKTLLAELRIASELARQPGKRAVYLAPYRVLARQVEETMRHGLRAAGASVKDLGTDFDVAIDDQLEPGQLPDVAVMTPERMDAIVRLSTSDRSGADKAAALMGSISLIVLDEAHLIGRPGRGPRLELLLARLRRQLPDSDLVALSAAAEGATEFAAWLGDPEAVFGGKSPTGTIELLWRTDGTLVQNFYGSTARVTHLSRSRTAIESAASLALRFRPEVYPLLIMETTRPNAENVARKMRALDPRAGERWRAQLNSEQQTALDDASEEARLALGESNDLAALLQDGIAYHHAGIPPHLLRAIERLAESRSLRAIGSTTTVAEGVHLPFVVVIVPHLNFQGATRRLEKDLYLNIRGRAGRANVAVEGLVILLDSDSRTLSGHVERRLWADLASAPIRGQLARITNSPLRVEEHSDLREFQSQVLAWLGEDPQESLNQASELAQATNSYSSQSSQRSRIEWLIGTCFDELEKQGLVQSASPYALTPLGKRARLAGIAPQSCLRLHNAIKRVELPRLIALFDELSAQRFLSRESVSLICHFLYQTEEVLQQSLWFRRLPLKTDAQKARVLLELSEGIRPWPLEEPLFEADLQLFPAWMMGTDFAHLGEQAPSFTRGIFSSTDAGVRAADAAEYVGRMSYAAAWSWSATLAMLAELGDEFPSWIRRSVEWGVPNETAVELMARLGVSRTGALQLSEQLGPNWTEAAPAMEDVQDLELRDRGVSNADVTRFLERRDRWIPPSWDDVPSPEIPSE